MSSNLTCPHCGQSHRSSARFCPTTGRLIQPSVQVQPGPEAAFQAGLTGRLPASTLLHNRFIIVKKIGQGGMAAVYQAADTWQTGTSWAVKEMSDAALLNPQERAAAIQAFQQEANLLQSLSHPNLPKVIDVFAEGGKYYLVMEFVPGQTLEQSIERRQQPFSENEILPWAIQLCDVLSYLHSQNPAIVFRDLKPANIMLTPAGQIKLIDFGIVRFFKPGKLKDTIAMGTPGYNAPEAMSGQTDGRSDIYSLCVTLHQLLTGYDPTTTLFNIPPARQINPAVSAGMEQILKHGLMFQREQRYANVQVMRNELVQLAAPATPRLLETEVIPSVKSPPGDLLKTSRPTARLIMAAARLSGKQFALLAGAAMVALVAASWLLTPALDRLSVAWNNLPLFAAFGAFGYAAYSRRGAAFVSHTLLTAALIVPIWLRAGHGTYTWTELAVALLASGIFMEAWLAFLPRVKAAGIGETWKREAAWLAGMAAIGTLIFFGILTDWITGYYPAQWLVGAAFGLLGWFLGDFIQQYLLFKKTGLHYRV